MYADPTPISTLHYRSQPLRSHTARTHAPRWRRAAQLDAFPVRTLLLEVDSAEVRVYVVAGIDSIDVVCELCAADELETTELPDVKFELARQGKAGAVLRASVPEGGDAWLCMYVTVPEAVAVKVGEAPLPPH